MNRYTILNLAALFIVAVSFYFLDNYFQRGSLLKQDWKSAQKEIIVKQDRTDITFILGEDIDRDNPYYKNAADYYRNHPVERTEWITRECRSLKDVQKYLGKYAGEQAWGDINLVAHSNEWRGMGVPVSGESGRTTKEQLTAAIDSEVLRPLDDSVIDHQTQINISACALGKDQQFLEMLAFAFGGNDTETPIVRSSKYFMSYMSWEGNTYKYHTAYYQTSYPTAYRPANIILANELSANYPEDAAYFRDALSRKTPRYPGDSYHNFFNIPVNWIVTFPTVEERPLLETKEEELCFLYEQEELLEVVATHQIPVDKFRWQFKMIDHTFDDGTTEPAILIKGKSSVLCVLQAITKTGTAEPFIPELANDQFYTTVVSNAKVASDLP